MSNNISIIIPVYNYQNVITTIKSLIKQSYPGNKEIIVIYDNPKVPLSYFFYSFLDKYNIKLIKNKSNLGLAGNYNIGIKESKYNNIMTIHEDCIMKDKYVIRNMVNKLDSKNNTFVVNAKIVTQNKWNNYDFWNKIINFRYLGTAGSIGKATVFNKDIFKKIGKFDSDTFSTAGEDMDFNYRLNKAKLPAYNSDEMVYHLHVSNKANLSTLLKKEFQFGEAHGAFKRKYNYVIATKFDFEWRLLSVILFGIIPFYTVSLIHALRNFYKTGWMLGLFIYPFIGILIMYTQTIAALKSFIIGRQKFKEEMFLKPGTMGDIYYYLHRNNMPYENI